MTRVLITGATGFIGSHLARACLARGDEVSIVARPQSSLARLADVSTQITVHRLTLTDTAKLRDCLTDTCPEVIFHAGAQTRFTEDKDLTDLSDSVNANLNGLIALLSAAATSAQPPRAFVRTGSIAEYGDIETPYIETAREAPRNAYGASVLAGTLFMAMAGPRLPFQAVTARLALTYGPDQSRDFLIPHLIDSFLNGRPITIQRPHDRRDLIHIDDVTRGLLMIAENPKAVGPVVNLCTGQAETMRYVTQTLAVLMDADHDLLSYSDISDPAVVLAGNPTRIHAALGWSPKTPLYEGLERTVQWVRQSATQPIKQRQGT